MNKYALFTFPKIGVNSASPDLDTKMIILLTLTVTIFSSKRGNLNSLQYYTGDLVRQVEIFSWLI